MSYRNPSSWMWQYYMLKRLFPLYPWDGSSTPPDWVGDARYRVVIWWRHLDVETHHYCFSWENVLRAVHGLRKELDVDPGAIDTHMWVQVRRDSLDVDADRLADAQQRYRHGKITLNQFRALVEDFSDRHPDLDSVVRVGGRRGRHLMLGQRRPRRPE